MVWWDAEAFWVPGIPIKNMYFCCVFFLQKKVESLVCLILSVFLRQRLVRKTNIQGVWYRALSISPDKHNVIKKNTYFRGLRLIVKRKSTIFFI